MTFAALLAVAGTKLQGGSGVAAAALSIQYAARITDELGSMVENLTLVSSQAVDVERVYEYVDLPAEELKAERSTKRYRLLLSQIAYVFVPTLAWLIEKV